MPSVAAVISRKCLRSMEALLLLNDGGSLDGVELRVVCVEVLVALRLNLGLVRSGIARRSVAVAAVKLVDDVHALDDFAERSEALAVEHSAVVGKVDEHLGRP